VDLCSQDSIHLKEEDILHSKEVVILLILPIHHQIQDIHLIHFQDLEHQLDTHNNPLVDTPHKPQADTPHKLQADIPHKHQRDTLHKPLADTHHKL